MPKRIIEVAGMDGMSRKQVRLTNGVANCLVRKHHMCLDCAIKFAVAFAWTRSGKKGKEGMRVSFCSAACSGAMAKFYEETLGSKGEEVTDPDELAMVNAQFNGRVQ